MPCPHHLASPVVTRSTPVSSADALRCTGQHANLQHCSVQHKPHSVWHKPSCNVPGGVIKTPSGCMRWVISKHVVGSQLFIDTPTAWPGDGRCCLCGCGQLAAPTACLLVTSRWHKTNLSRELTAVGSSQWHSAQIFLAALTVCCRWWSPACCKQSSLVPNLKVHLSLPFGMNVSYAWHGGQDFTLPVACLPPVHWGMNCYLPSVQGGRHATGRVNCCLPCQM